LKKTERVMGSIRTNVNQAELNYCKHFGETGEFKKNILGQKRDKRRTVWGKNVVLKDLKAFFLTAVIYPVMESTTWRSFRKV